MALKVKSVVQSAQKWVDRAGAATEDYATQGEAAGEAWAGNTQKAGDTFFQAVSVPTIKTRFVAGARRAGAAKFSRGIREKGRVRFGPGVQAGQGDYSTGVDPYLTTIAALTLSPRRPRGDTANYARGQQVGTALHAKRIALLGGGS